jgi:hypothetical protein
MGAERTIYTHPAQVPMAVGHCVLLILIDQIPPAPRTTLVGGKLPDARPAAFDSRVPSGALAKRFSLGLLVVDFRWYPPLPSPAGTNVEIGCRCGTRKA